MNQELSNAKKPNYKLLILALVFLISLSALFYYLPKESSLEAPLEGPLETEISLSLDQKEITRGEDLILGVKDEAIFNYFNTSFLCDESNINSDAERVSFCQDRDFFETKVKFSNLYIPKDERQIIFSLETDVMSPDKALGAHYLDDSRTVIFSTYYLGNDFISFSPSGTYFVYKGGCFEAKCALHILNSQTLEVVATLSDSQYPDARMNDVDFVNWLSDNEVEYLLGKELRQASFN